MKRLLTYSVGTVIAMGVLVLIFTNIPSLKRVYSNNVVQREEEVKKVQESNSASRNLIVVEEKGKNKNDVKSSLENEEKIEGDNTGNIVKEKGFNENKKKIKVDQKTNTIKTDIIKEEKQYISFNEANRRVCKICGAKEIDGFYIGESGKCSKCKLESKTILYCEGCGNKGEFYINEMCPKCGLSSWSDSPITFDNSLAITKQHCLVCAYNYKGNEFERCPNCGADPMLVGFCPNCKSYVEGLHQWGDKCPSCNYKEK